MSWIWNWFRGGRASTNIQHTHSQIRHFCCSDICRYDRNVCHQCLDYHKGHILMQSSKFKQVNQKVLQQINYRKKIQGTIREYNQRLLSFFEDLLEKQTDILLKQITDKIFSKNFTQIYKRHLQNKPYYSYIPQFQSSHADQINLLISKTIKQKQKRVNQFLKSFISENKIILSQYIVSTLPQTQGYPSQNKIDRIKAIMPFPCQLKQKFQASKLRFQTTTLHKLGIRGPILLVAESYKGMIFGGYSPKMFPKAEHYEEDNKCRSFLFSLNHRVRLPLKQEFKKYAIKGGNNLWFGRGDLVIANQCNKGNISWAQIGRAYHLPQGIKCDPHQWLGGALYFQIIQYEIYEVQSSQSVGR